MAAFVRQVTKRAHDAMLATENYGHGFRAGTMGAGLGRWLLCLPYFRGHADTVRDLRPEMRAGLTAAVFTPPLPPEFFADRAAAPFYRQYGAHVGGWRRFAPRRREVAGTRALEWIGDARSAPFTRTLSVAAITGDADLSARADSKQLEGCLPPARRRSTLRVSSPMRSDATSQRRHEKVSVPVDVAAVDVAADRPTVAISIRLQTVGHPWMAVAINIAPSSPNATARGPSARH